MDKSKFFESVKLKTEPFELPTGEAIEFRELTAGQRQAVFQAYKTEDAATAQAKLVVFGCGEFEEKDIKSLLGLPGDLLQSMAEVVMRLSGLSGDDPKKGS